MYMTHTQPGRSRRLCCLEVSVLPPGCGWLRVFRLLLVRDVWNCCHSSYLDFSGLAQLRCQCITNVERLVSITLFTRSRSALIRATNED